MLKVPIEMPDVCSECFFLSDYETSIHHIDEYQSRIREKKNETD